jgi:hypothetical protein
LKNGIVETLTKLDYDVKPEKRTEDGRVDVFATNKDGTELNVEIVRTHLSNWVLVKLGVPKKLSETTTIQIKKTTHQWLVDSGKYGESMDDIINRLTKRKKEVVT